MSKSITLSIPGEGGSDEYVVRRVSVGAEASRKISDEEVCNGGIGIAKFDDLRFLTRPPVELEASDSDGVRRIWYGLLWVGRLLDKLGVLSYRREAGLTI